MKNNSIKTVVATGIGAALFIIIGTLINIPTPIPNTNLQLQYAVVALFAVVYGPTVGFFSGFIGHALKDALQYGSPWWTWVLVSGLIGLSIGLVAKKIKIEKGQLTEKDLVWFNSAQILANVVGALLHRMVIFWFIVNQQVKSLLKVFYQLPLIA